MVVTAPNETFLRKEFYVPRIFEIMEPQLWFLDNGMPGMLPIVKSDSKAVTYKKETTSAASDTQKRTPRAKTELAKWTYVNISQMTETSAILNSKGFAVKISRDAIRFTEGVDEIKRAFKRVGYYLAQSINTDITTAIIDGATTPDWTPHAVWSASDATPVDDLIRLEAQMEREGYPYELTDTLIHKTNFTELKAYLTSLDIDGTKQKDIYGQPQISKSKIDIPIIQGSVHKMQSGISEGSVIGLDRNNPCGTIYYNNDPKYSSENITYNTVVDGKVTPKTVPNIGINTHTYEDNESHATIIQLWYDMVTAVQEPYGALYDTGI